MIRYALYDPKSRRYDLFSTNHDWLAEYRESMAETYNLRGQSQWAKNTRFEKEYRLNYEYYKRLEIVKFKLTRV